MNLFATCLCGDLALAHDGHCSKCACPAFVASGPLAGACAYVATCGCVCDFPAEHAGMHRCEHIGPYAFGMHATHGAAYADYLAAQAVGDIDNGD